MTVPDSGSGLGQVLSGDDYRTIVDTLLTNAGRYGIEENELRRQVRLVAAELIQLRVHGAMAQLIRDGELTYVVDGDQVIFLPLVATGWGPFGVTGRVAEVARASQASRPSTTRP